MSIQQNCKILSTLSVMSLFARPSVSFDLRQSFAVRYRRIGLVTLSLVWLAGCCGGVGQPACNNPNIVVTPSPGMLSISGSNFSNVSQCAHLSMSGLPPGLPAPTGVISIGDPQCNGGAFQNFNWPYSYFNCTPSTSQSVTVLGVDSQTVKGGSQSISIPWGPTCGIVGHTQCGDEGEIPCANGCNAGPPDLHPDLKDGMLVCTKNCGHTQGYSPCTPDMDGCPAQSGTGTLVAPQRACVTTQNNLKIFNCYDHAMIEQGTHPATSCFCVPNTLNSCSTNSSLPKDPAPLTGTCVSAQFLGC
jgi:hypothetical protein